MLSPCRPSLNAYGVVGTRWLGGPDGGERFAVSP